METLPSGMKKYEANDNATVENFNANADLLDEKLSELDEHVSAADGHGATSAATAGRIALRDANGRFKVGAPSAADDVATKGYVDTEDANMAKTNIDNHFSASQSVGGTLTAEMVYAVRAGLPLQVLWNTLDNVALRSSVNAGFYNLQNVPTNNIAGGFYNDLLKIPVDGSEMYTGAGHKVWHEGNAPSSTWYQRFPDGKILQYTNVNSASGGYVTFPVVFNELQAILITLNANGYAYYTDATNFGFNVHHTGGGVRNLSYLAIGR
ncbi:hypothetical protein PAECIP111893_03522 [Paenibacillus plantiphilus]|uniref:Putative tail fiber protein gp53-like C-terminal domain-containing protein n=1 Tax=Paenibacillus plantiphilus TaxID=2905650 RepID=A0ABN8GUS0_9BACL|nr:hypothetical protein [Paenibacillus plantiphilus]CAH1212338.1 hypothetical protein PAECIP111893_03522 [Paenibacillus plantiphilus]